MSTTLHRRTTAAVAAWLLLGLAVPAFAQHGGNEVAELRRAVEEQRARMARQAEDLKRQQEALEEQTRELETLSARLAELAGEAGGTVPQPAKPAGPGGADLQRDAVGDLNATAVAAGDFPGSFRIPGSRDVSLAIGGFVKTVAIADSNLEGTGAIFLPASTGTSRPDEDGNFGFDATLTRVQLDARAPAGSGGLVRGYVETDLNGTNNGSLSSNLRHAYGTWQTRRGTLTFGHTWSTLMDLKILPEGLTEPTVSGAIFQRQAQLRWTQPLSERSRLDFALEDPTSRDLFTDQPGLTRSGLPDLVVGAERDWPDRGHLRVTGVARRLELGEEAGGGSDTGWGLSTGAHFDLGAADKLALSASYGEGLGRYLLGLPASAGGFVDPGDGRLQLIESWGGFASYRHRWSKSTRSTFALGHARLDLPGGAPADAFSSSTFGMVNLLWSPLPYLTLGTEYQFGEREDVDGSRRENHRLIFGVQVY